ncbi:hypothetical protein D9M72_595430 [compost metagenome]
MKLQQCPIDTGFSAPTSTQTRIGRSAQTAIANLLPEGRSYAGSVDSGILSRSIIKNVVQPCHIALALGRRIANTVVVGSVEEETKVQFLVAWQAGSR